MLRYTDTPPSFSTFFTERNNSCDFLFPFLDNTAVPEGVYSERKEFAPWFFKTGHKLRRETEMKMARVASPKSVSIITLNV